MLSLLSTPQDKQMAKQSKEFMSAMKLAEDDDRKVQLFRRESRTTPAEGDQDAMIEYFLNTVGEDMDFEVSRCRPRLDALFFRSVGAPLHAAVELPFSCSALLPHRHLDGVMGKERFAAKPDEDKLVELEALRDYLTGACEALDQVVTKTGGAKER